MGSGRGPVLATQRRRSCAQGPPVVCRFGAEFRQNLLHSAIVAMDGYKLDNGRSLPPEIPGVRGKAQQGHQIATASPRLKPPSPKSAIDPGKHPGLNEKGIMTYFRGDLSSRDKRTPPHIIRVTHASIAFYLLIALYLFSGSANAQRTLVDLTKRTGAPPAGVLGLVGYVSSNHDQSIFQLSISLVVMTFSSTSLSLTAVSGPITS